MRKVPHLSNLVHFLNATDNENSKISNLEDNICSLRKSEAPKGVPTIQESPLPRVVNYQYQYGS